MLHPEIMKVSSGVSSYAGRPTWAEIDLDALAANFQAVRRQVGSGVKVAAVVKANAYGHGAVRCAERLAAEGADWFSVALPEEGIALRQAKITEPILCLGGFWEGQAEACLQYKLVPVIYRIDMAEAYHLAAQAAGVVADVHIKIDTGMGRLGVRSDNVDEFAARLRSFKNIRVDGVMTHFAAADAPDQDCFTNEQVARFQEALNHIRARGHNPTYEDMANSPAIYAHPKARANMVRPGGVLYGLWRDVLQPQSNLPEFSLVMRLRSCITLLKWVHRGETLGYGCTFEAARETLVATLPIGYHDGYMRALSNRGRAIVRGRYAPVVGRVSMDLTLVDVTDVPDVALGDPVTLMGTDGELSISVEDVAKTAGTLSYEVTCGISERVPRRYLPEAQ
ncbi:MAG: alanine racemase [Pyrinomonadaceae bacterium]|nr:alanine racemase [Pyrinomonadaceae bacterium]